jgi:DNA mismatch endonuclease (patch repair protein)
VADVHSKEVRSYNMSRIRSTDTKPEILIRKKLFKMGYRYRLYDKTLPGKPDIVLKKFKTVIFVNGCFWHGHDNCKYFVIPKTKTEWWLEKIKKTKENDIKHRQQLNELGFRVIDVFECELKKDKIENTLTGLKNELH